MVAPIIPGLNDHEIEKILDAVAGMGAREAGYVLLRLPLEVAPVFKEWLLRHYPERYRHVLSLIRSMRGGKDYDAEWGKRMRGTGPYAWQIAGASNWRRNGSASTRKTAETAHRPVRRRRSRRSEQLSLL
jgi:DNA repair photolyase